MRSRRDFLALAALGAAGGSAVSLAACGGGGEDDAGTGTTEKGGPGDVGVLNSALDLEHLSVASYAAGIELLDASERELGRRLLEHEREHVAGLTQAIRDLGGEPNRARPRAAYERMLDRARGGRGFLRFAADLESTAIAAYAELLPKLSVPELRQTAMAILASEAQHLAAVRGALGLAQAPDPLVGGERAL